MTGLRKGETITIQLDGDIGKLTHPVFTPGNFSEEGGDDPYWRYDLYLVEGNVDAGLSQDKYYTWYANKTYFKQIDPLVTKGHSSFRIKRIRGKEEKDAKGNPLPVGANYKITQADEPDPEFARMINGT